MPISQFNNWNAPLAAFGFPGDVFNGAPEPTGTASAISVNILCGTLTTLTIQQSYNTSNFYYQQQYQIQGGQLTTIQMPVVMPYFRVNILNETQATQQYCNMNTSLVPQLTQSVDIRPLTAATDTVSLDLTGAVIDVSGGTVEVTNFPAVQTISGTVAVSSQPHLSYLTDNVAVATMPHLSKTTDSVDISGQTVVVGSGTNLIGKVLTFENPSSVISLTGVSTIGQTIKATAGSLFNISAFNGGNAVSYLKLYNVAVPTNTDTPIMTFPILHDSPINTISIHNYQFSTAIGVRATANYIANDTTAPNGITSIVAFYNGVTP